MNPELLSELRPNLGSLNRDAVLFAAGRSSARPSSAWKWACVALALGNVGWLASYRTNPPPVVVPMPPKGVPPSPSPEPEVVAAEMPEVWPRRRIELPPTRWIASPAPPRPMLTAGTDPRMVSIYN